MTFHTLVTGFERARTGHASLFESEAVRQPIYQKNIKLVFLPKEG